MRALGALGANIYFRRGVRVAEGARLESECTV